MSEEKERPGYTWIPTNTGGYWSKNAPSGARHSHKVPIFCPYEECNRLTGTIDEKYLKQYGVCALCYTMYVDAREKPLIDVEKYRLAVTNGRLDSE